MMWHFALFILALIAGCSATTEINCTAGGKFMTPNMRYRILKYHNELRSSLAKGLETDKHGKLYPAKNMYKLRYDCFYETKAEAFFNSAAEKTSANAQKAVKPLAANFHAKVYHGNNMPDKIKYENYVKEAIDDWWNQTKTIGLPGNGNRYLDINTREFATMAYSPNIRMGCSVYKGSNNASLVCVYDDEPTLVFDIYRIGQPCQKNSDCTTYSKSTCVYYMGLCKSRRYHR